MTIDIEYDIEDEEIGEFVSSFPEATFFHTPSWMDILVSSFQGFRGGWITARNGSSLAGVMPFIRIDRGPLFSVWSMPFGTYGTPLSTGDDITLALIGRFSEIAGSPRCFDAAAFLCDLGTDSGGILRSAAQASGECSIIRLDGDFQTYRSDLLSRKKRQTCNICERKGVEIRLLRTREDLSVFYKIYLEGSPGWGGVHPYPARFFEKLFDRRDEGILFWGAFVQGKMLGGHVDIYYNRFAQAWQAGVSEESRSTGIASYLVYRAVEEAYKREMKIFNLGSSGGDRGMLFFKRSMGGEEHDYPILEVKKRWWRWLKRR